MIKVITQIKGLIYFTFFIAVFTFNKAGAQNYNVGFKQVKLTNGLLISIWYPTETKDSSFIYTRSLIGSVAQNAAIASGRFPLIVFSHGFTGCGIQSVFFTEELARNGYIVAAPDHKDATCALNSETIFKMQAPEQPWGQPDKWSEATYQNRKADMDSTINYFLNGTDFTGKVDVNKIGATGHSLGGYTVFGLAGGWESWKSKHIKAILIFSPYLSPYQSQNRMAEVSVPVMYQGAELDLALTPQMRMKDGLFDLSKAPKYYVELSGGNHFEWSNVVCMGQRTVTECLENKRMQESSMNILWPFLINT